MILAIIGHISAGKTSTARIIAQLLNAEYIAADDVHRDLGFASDLADESVSHERIAATTTATYAEIERRLGTAMRTVVLDAVPTVDDLHALIQSHRTDSLVFLLYCDETTWHARELARRDRQPLEEHIRELSIERGHALGPDYSIDTSDLRPGDIALAIVTWLRARGQPKTTAAT